MARTASQKEIGFGFSPEVSAHHFVLIIPDAEDQPVLMEERFDYGEGSDFIRSEARAALDTYRWQRAMPKIQAHFNRRLSDSKRQTSAFQPGENILAPYLGKELTLLMWALDGVDETELPNALANWLGFVPEERWWLFSTVKASGAAPEDDSKGWRKAIKIAFAESPAPPPADAGPGITEEQPYVKRRKKKEPEPDEKPSLPIDVPETILKLDL